MSANSRWQLLHVDVCCKSLTSQVPLKGPKELEITGHEMWTVRRLVHIFPALMPSRGTSRYSGWQYGDLQFVSLETLKKHLAGRRMATDADVKQALLTSTGTLHWLLRGRDRNLDAKVWIHACISLVTVWKSDVYHLLPMYYIKVRINFSTSVGLLPNFLNYFVQYKIQLWSLQSREEINKEEICEKYERTEMAQEEEYNARNKQTFRQC